MFNGFQRGKERERSSFSATPVAVETGVRLIQDNCQPMPAANIQALDERIMPLAAELIWSVLADAKGFPEWSPPSVKTRLLEAAEGLVGTRFELQPRGGRAFQCRVEAVEAPRLMRMSYPEGFITGWGEWRLEPLDAGRTRVSYKIDVSANGWLAAILGRVLSLPKLHSKAMQDILVALEHETARRCNQTSGG